MYVLDLHTRILLDELSLAILDARQNCKRPKKEKPTWVGFSSDEVMTEQRAYPNRLHTEVDGIGHPCPGPNTCPIKTLPRATGSLRINASSWPMRLNSVVMLLSTT